MRVTLTGTGISQGVPVIGCTCPACHSEDPRDLRLRTSAVLSHRGRMLALDIGPDFRQQMLRARIGRLDAVLVTHEHSDHVAGLDDIRPYNWIMGGDIPIYAEPNVLEALAQRFPYAFLPRSARYPGAPGLVPHPIQEPGLPIDVAGLEVLPLRVYHGGLAILGFRCHSMAYITDSLTIPPETEQLLYGLDLLIINALRRTSHPSHLSLDQALAVIACLRPERAVLTHLSHEMGPHREVEQLLPPGVSLGYDGMSLEV